MNIDPHDVDLSFLDIPAGISIPDPDDGRSFIPQEQPPTPEPGIVPMVIERSPVTRVDELNLITAVQMLTLAVQALDLTVKDLDRRITLQSEPAVKRRRRRKAEPEEPPADHTPLEPQEPPED